MFEDFKTYVFSSHTCAGYFSFLVFDLVCVCVFSFEMKIWREVGGRLYKGGIRLSPLFASPHKSLRPYDSSKLCGKRLGYEVGFHKRGNKNYFFCNTPHKKNPGGGGSIGCVLFINASRNGFSALSKKNKERIFKTL